MIVFALHSVPENFQVPFGISPEICYELNDRPRQSIKWVYFSSTQLPRVLVFPMQQQENLSGGN